MTTPPVASSADRIDVDSHMLLGDIARAEQRDEDAAQHYLDAALASDDPTIAERTAQEAYRLALDAVGIRAVNRWRELDPDAPGTLYFGGIFAMRSGRAGAAIDEFSDFVDLYPEGEQGRALATVFEALATEPATTAAAAIMYELNARYPGTREGHYALAQLALRAGDFELAVEESETVVDLWPDEPQAQLLHARALLLSGRTAEALELGSELVSSDESVETKLEFAELLLSANETGRAEQLLDEILDENPGMAEAIRALAYLALNNNELDRAREQFEMLRGDPAYRDEAYFYLGRIAEMESDFLQATRAYQRITQGIRAVEAQRRTAGILYFEFDDPEGALRHLREYGDANPRFAPEMLLSEARLLLDMNRPDDAIALIDDAVGDDLTTADLSLQTAHVNFYAELAQDAIDDGDLDAAEARLEEGLARYPGNTTLRYSLSLLLQQQGHLRRAISVLEDLVAEEPGNASFLNALGYLLTDKTNRHTEARGYIQRALAMRPDDGAILDSMGWVLFRLGELELARNYLERALVALEVPEVVAHLIDVHWALGNRDTALQMLDEALAESPDDPFLVDVSERIRE